VDAVPALGGGQRKKESLSFLKGFVSCQFGERQLQAEV
jgi:hypothetical protein